MFASTIDSVAAWLVLVLSLLSNWTPVPPTLVVADHSLAERIEEAALGWGCQVVGPTQFGAWARKAL